VWPDQVLPEWPEAGVFICALVLGLVGAVVARSYARPEPLSRFRRGSDFDRLKVESERDRVMAAAKGLATTSVGFFTTLVTALLKGDVPEQVGLFSLLGSLLGAMAVLLMAADLSRGARRFTRRPTVALLFWRRF
jgi:uncharacterized membrane protein YeaQ/YmgE (transglycosylase-associated protein family)